MSHPSPHARRLRGPAILVVGLLALLAACLPGATWEPKAGPQIGTGVALLTHVQVGRSLDEGGYNRVVFIFENSVPAWTVEYIPMPPIEDPTGEPVPMAGNFGLQVRMMPASGFDLSGPTARPTYTGPTRIGHPGPEVVEVTRTGDFEAVLAWVIGTVHLKPFRVAALTGPPRLVVDVSNS